MAIIGGPEGCAGRFANFSRPSYLEWAVFDVVVAGSAIAQGLRLVVCVSSSYLRDE